MSKAYCIGHLKISDKERFMTEYAAHVPATLQPYQGKVIVKGGEVSYREGEDLGQLDVVIEFPNINHRVYHECVRIRLHFAILLATICIIVITFSDDTRSWMSRCPITLLANTVGLYGKRV